MKIKQKLMILMCISALFLSACNNSAMTSKEEEDDVLSTQATVTQEVTSLTELTNDSFDEVDLYGDWSKAKATDIVMSDTDIATKGTEAESIKIEGTTVTITKGGLYDFSGSCADGAIIVDSEDSENVRLVFNGLSLTNKKGCALYIKKSAKTVLTASGKSSNVLTDGSDYTEAEEGVNAVIFSLGDLTFNGEGQFIINGNHQDGISCGGNLKITSGTMNIQSADDGIVANTGLSIKNGSFNIQCPGNAMKTTSVGEGQGYIGIESGNYTFTTSVDAVNATDSIYVLNGSFTTITGNGSTVESTATGWGNFGDGDQTAKGLKAGGSVEIYGGLLNFDTADDAIYANENVHVNTGCLNISSGDDGIVAAESLTVNGGSIIVSKAYVGFEANAVALNSGYMDITSVNDGVNVAGGASGSASEARAGKNELERSGSGEFTIKDTCINVKADADAVDVAGNICIESGSINVRSANDAGLKSIACTGEYTVHGGVVTVVGNESEMTLPSEASQQGSVYLEYSEPQAENDIICIMDKDDNVVTCFAPSAPYQKVLISKTAFEKGEKYTWYHATASDSSAVVFGEVGQNGYVLGEKIAEFKVEDGITKVNS